MGCSLEAEIAYKENEVPIGCVFVKDGKVIAKGHNFTNASGNVGVHTWMEPVGYVARRDGCNCRDTSIEWK